MTPFLPLSSLSPPSLPPPPPGGEITSTFDHPELVKLGHCQLIEEVMIGEDTLIHFSGVAMGTQLLHQSQSASCPPPLSVTPPPR